MKVAKIRLWDGSEFFTDKIERDYIANFFKNARKEFGSGKREDKGIMQQIDIIEMTPEEYNKIPATNDSSVLFS